MLPLCVPVANRLTPGLAEQAGFVVTNVVVHLLRCLQPTLPKHIDICCNVVCAPDWIPLNWIRLTHEMLGIRPLLIDKMIPSSK